MSKGHLKIKVFSQLPILSISNSASLLPTFIPSLSPLLHFTAATLVYSVIISHLNCFSNFFVSSQTKPGQGKKNGPK